MATRKKFKDTTVGKILMGVVGAAVPGLGAVLEGTSTVGQALSAIKNSDLPAEDRVMLEVKLLEIEEKELERDIIAQQEVTKRWTSDNSAGKLTRFVRPSMLIFVTVIMLLFTYLDSAKLYDFTVKESWVGFWQVVATTIYGGYFLGKSMEKTFNSKR